MTIPTAVWAFRQGGPRVHRERTYVSRCEGEHGQEDDGKLPVRDLGADSSQNSHDGTRLQRDTLVRAGNIVCGCQRPQRTKVVEPAKFL